MQASNATDAGSAPSGFFKISTPALSVHTSNCSIAAALKVSAAATKTFLPSALKFAEIFPIEVVLPAPLTPTTNITSIDF